MHRALLGLAGRARLTVRYKRELQAPDWSLPGIKNSGQLGSEGKGLARVVVVIVMLMLFVAVQREAGRSSKP